MTTIRTWDRNGQMGIEITGHAGYATSGSDIVCAGVSGMCYVLTETAHALSAAGLIDEVEIQAQDGLFALRLRVRPVGATAARCLIDGARAATARLQGQYPGHVQVVR